MPSFGAYSQYAYSDGPTFSAVPASLRRLAQARTADPIVFLEVTARANAVTFLEDVLKEPAGTFIRPYSALPYSSRELPRTERQTVSFLFSTRPWCGAPNDPFRPNQRALPRIITAGRISRSVPIDASVARRGQRTIGDASLSNPDRALDAILTDYTLDGGAIRAWLGEPGQASNEWALVYEASIDRVDATRQEIRIGITTVSDQLERALQVRSYAGTGGINGDSGVAGRLRPVAFGEIWGADPVLISKADNIYQVHDSQIQNIDWVREGGLDYTATSDYPDYDSLSLASLSSGTYATCLALGLFRIGVSIDGLVYPLRVGLQGDASGRGYVSATGDILYRIARDRAFLAASTLDVASFNALPRGRVGFYSNGASDLKCSDVFDKLLGGVVGTYGLGRREKISVKRLLPAAFSLTDVAVRGSQFVDLSVDARPYTPRNNQPYTYAPTAGPPLSDSEVSPEADETVANRLKATAQKGWANQTTTAVVPQVPISPIVTYFAEESAAQQIAIDSLAFSSRNLVPVRGELGRVGLTAEVGSVLAITDARFAANFRGIVYEQEDNLGAAVTSRIVALG